MHFDYTSIQIFGFTLWEPMVSVTNFTLFFISLHAFFQLKKFRNPYTYNMTRFMLLIGVAGCFGAVAHGIHYDFGKPIFNVVVYVSNAISLISAYYCFAGAYRLQVRGENSTKRGVLNAMAVWIVLMLIVTLIWNTFLIIKIHAGVILLYSLVVHIISWRKYQERGSGIVVLGIFVSFFSLLVHSLGFSIHEYFNYKDIAHVFMIISMIIIYKGVRINSEKAAI